MANSGIFSVDDINYLRDHQQWDGDKGSLELIGTQDMTGSRNIDFTKLGKGVYGAHILYLTNLRVNKGSQQFRMRFIEESSVPTSGYAYARMAFQTDGSGTSESRANNTDGIEFDNTGSESWLCNYTIYLFNLNSWDKMPALSFSAARQRYNTSGNINWSGTYQAHGGGIYFNGKNKHIYGLRIYNSAQDTISGKASLYGLKGSSL